MSLSNNTDTPQDAPTQHIPAYPPPPPYYLYFPANDDSTITSSPTNAFMIPPPPIHEMMPVGTTHHQVFGAYYDLPIILQKDGYGEIHTKRRERHTVRPAEQDIRELFGGDSGDTSVDASKRAPPSNKKQHLKALLKSLILNYISLLKILELNPMEKIQDVPDAYFFVNEAPGEKTSVQWKMQQIHLILTNMHYILNLYRPAQARAQLKGMLERQGEEWEKAVKMVSGFMEEYVGVIRERYGEELEKAEVKLEDETRTASHKRKRGDLDVDVPENELGASEEDLEQGVGKTHKVTPSFMIPQSILNEFFS